MLPYMSLRLALSCRAGQPRQLSGVRRTPQISAAAAANDHSVTSRPSITALPKRPLAASIASGAGTRLDLSISGHDPLRIKSYAVLHVNCGGVFGEG